MKVFQLTHNYPSEEDKTEGIFIHRTNRAIAEKVDISVIVLKPSFQTPKLKNKYKIDGIDVYVVNYFRPRGRLFNSLDGVFMLSAIQLVRKIINKLDIVHSHWQTDSGVLGRFISGIFNVPHIVSVRGARIFYKTKTSLYWAISKAVFKKSNLIHTHGKNIYSELISKYQIPQNKLMMIPNIIFDKKKLKSLLEVYKQRKINKLNKTVLFVGLDGKNKGLLDVVQSFLGASNENHKLNIVTNLSSYFFNSKIKPIISSKSNISVFNRTSQENILKLFMEADVFLFPSFAEGSPNVILEAMAAGCYIISYKIRGLENLIEHNQNGRLVEKNNVQGLTKEIDMFISNQMENEFKRYRDFNYSFIAENYDFISNTHDYINMYKRLSK